MIVCGTCVVAFTAGCSMDNSSGGASSSAPTTSAIAAPVKSAVLGIVMPQGATLYDSSDRHRGSGDGLDPASEGDTTEIWSIPGQYLAIVKDMAQRLPLRHDFTAASHSYPFCHEVIKDTPNDTMTEWTWGVSEQDMVAVRMFPNRELSGIGDTGLDVTAGPAGDTGCRLRRQRTAISPTPTPGRLVIPLGGSPTDNVNGWIGGTRCLKQTFLTPR
jgi:hypothetical protein